MQFLPIIRLIALATVVVFSIIVLGVSSHITWFTTTYYKGYFTFAAFAIAISALSLITLPVMIAIDFMRKGAFTSLVVVELSWLGVLWVLWLSAAALSADANVKVFLSGCGYDVPAVDQGCREFAAVEAFSFLNWLILFAYTILLLVFAIIGSTRGHKSFTSTVAENQFLAPRAGGQPNYQEKPTMIPQDTGSYQPQPQAQYPQGQYPQGQYPPQVATPVSYPQTHTPPVQGYPQV